MTAAAADAVASPTIIMNKKKTPTHGYYRLYSQTFDYRVNKLHAQFGRSQISSADDFYILSTNRALSRHCFIIEYVSSEWRLRPAGKNIITVNGQTLPRISEGEEAASVVLYKDKPSAIQVADVKMYFLPAIQQT